MKPNVSLLCFAAVAAFPQLAQARDPVIHTLVDSIWADVTCLDVNASKLRTKRYLLSPRAGLGNASSFRLRVTELRALRMPEGKYSFASDLLERQLGATCAIDLDRSQLASVPRRDATSSSAEAELKP